MCPEIDKIFVHIESLSQCAVKGHKINWRYIRLQPNVLLARSMIVAQEKDRIGDVFYGLQKLDFDSRCKDVLRNSRAQH